ncbi:MAG: hypothetical protein ACREQV_24945 [Candidatus Binatia bacterium]
MKKKIVWTTHAIPAVRTLFLIPLLILPAERGLADAYSDWIERSTHPSVLMATGFDTPDEVNSWRAGTSQNPRNRDHLSWEARNTASGAGALRFDIFKEDGDDSGNWARWLSDDQREFDEGDEFYVQFRQYVPYYYATHVFKGGGGWKQIIISRNDSVMNGVPQSGSSGSFQVNEIVLQNSYHRSYVQGYNFNGDKFSPWESGARTACSSTDVIFQGAIDRGPQSVGSACENDRARYGGLYSYEQQQPGNYRKGHPDPLTGAFIYYPDEWVTYLVHVRIGNYGEANHHVRVWGAREGVKEYTLIHDLDIKLGNGPLHNTLWLTPYHTGRQPDPTRQDTYTLYDEVIVSTSFIPAPGAAPDPAPAAPENVQAR